jgi:glycosyltransferase involved in cell wall biosynthesis
VRPYVVGGPLYDTAGSQYTLDELRALAGSLGLDGRVGFPGFAERPAAAFRALDVVVHASTQPEPFGLVIAEAMACGRAVVTSASGGAAELVTNNVDALTHAPGDVAGLAAAIERVTADATLRHRLGDAARARAERSFDPDVFSRAFIDLYSKVARQAAPVIG